MKSSDTTRKHFFFVIFAISFVGVLFLLSKITGIVAISVIYSIMIYPLYRFLGQKLRLGEYAASVLALLGSFVTIIVPLSIVFNILLNELLSLRGLINNYLTGSTANLHSLVDQINNMLSLVPGGSYYFVTPEKLQLFLQQFIKPLSSLLVNSLVNTAYFVGDAVIFLILVFFLLPVLPKLRKLAERLSPLENNMDETYINRALSITKNMVNGAFIVAVVQGICGGLLAWIVGLDYILSLTILMMIFSLIPILGTAFITIPIGIVLILMGQYWQGALLIVGQIFFVSTIDNVLRSFLAPKDAGLHPALLLLSFFGGLQVFGPLGIFYGPIIMILFITSVEMYLKHYT